MICARPGRLCGAVMAYKQIDIKEPRQAVNLSGAVGAISILGGVSGISSSSAFLERWRGLALGYYTGSSRPGSCSTLDRIGEAVRTPSPLIYYGYLVRSGCGGLHVRQSLL